LIVNIIIAIMFEELFTGRPIPLLQRKNSLFVASGIH
jgi:hypothetical protein